MAAAPHDHMSNNPCVLPDSARELKVIQTALSCTGPESNEPNREESHWVPASQTAFKEKQ